MSSPHHFIIGGQRSGKSRHAERLALKWLAEQPGRAVTVVATAQASDNEMGRRIERHRLDRPPVFDTHEEPLNLGAAVRALSITPERLLLVDCLTLWWSQVMFPNHVKTLNEPPLDAESLRLDLLSALAQAQGPVILIANDIGSGVIPLGAEVRAFVDEMGRVNQQVVQCCGQITWMMAGQPFTQAVERWAS